MNNNLLKQQMWFVYILECVDNTFYTGITNNLTKRIEAHNNGKGAKYTKYRSPVVLIYFEIVDSKSSALKREIAIHKMRRLEKEKLVSKMDFKVNEKYLI